MFNYMGYYYTSEKINVLDLMPFFIKKEKKKYQHENIYTRFGSLIGGLALIAPIAKSVVMCPVTCVLLFLLCCSISVEHQKIGRYLCFYFYFLFLFEMDFIYYTKACPYLISVIRIKSKNK